MLVECRSPQPNSRPLFPDIPVRNPLTERLERFVNLDGEEREALDGLLRPRRLFSANDTLVREGRTPNRVYLILSGVAFRYRYLANGRRQIFGYLLPGDLCDTQFVIFNEADHNVGVLNDTEVAVIPLPILMEVMVRHPRIERALLMMSLIESATLREWLLNVGQRDAKQKLAHFFCEMHARFQSHGLDEVDEDFSLPLTQIELADTMGLTVVHVNRILQGFRREGLLNWSRRHVSILNHAILEQIAGFNSSYLQLQPQPREPRLNAYG